MQNPVVIIGIGEIGGVFAHAFLRSSYPIYPAVRDTVVSEAERTWPRPDLVIVSVGEQALQPVLAELPKAWRDRVVLIQNELLPGDWHGHDLTDPTVASIWFEKKKGQLLKIVVPTPVCGPNAKLLQGVLAAVDIPVVVVPDLERMVFELVRKNLYILTTNICGLRVDGTVGELWSEHEQFARDVSDEVLDLQQALTGSDLDREKLITAMLIAFNGDPDHKCQGRSAEQRLRRAVELGNAHGLDLPVLRATLAEQNNG